MKIFAIGLLVGLFSLGGHAKVEKQCKENYKKISCSDVEGAKRKAFCAKADPTPDRLEKLCKKKRTKKKNMAKAKKDSSLG